MDHVAIMNKQWHLIPKILNGEKTIESRWYKTKRAPWENITKGDTIYFKNSGEPVTAQATVDRALFFNLHRTPAKEIITKYGNAICLHDTSGTWAKDKNYCILVFLKEPRPVKPFTIDKTGYGNANAWLCVENINTIKQ